MSLLFYKRPTYVDRIPGPMDPVEYERHLERSRKAIPSELSFDMVIANRAIPPCSLQDFMGYLRYVSHDAENLQFYLWLQDYRRRFYKLSRNERALSPLWCDDLLPGQNPLHADNGPRLPEKSIDQAIDCNIDFDTGDATQEVKREVDSQRSGFPGSNLADTVEFANQQTGLKWQSFTIQPFRPEIDRIISHYLAPGAPRELNLSQKQRSACLHALQHTTHPSAFQIPASVATQTLRNHSHPNFIRWSTANGNRPRILFGRILGGLNILFGFLIAILLLLSRASRWWRIWALPVWFLGFAFLLAGANGICLVLYVTQDRHLRPWEQFSNGSKTSLASRPSTGGSSGRRPSSVFPDFETQSADDQSTLVGSDSSPFSDPEKVRLHHVQKSQPPKKTRTIRLEAFGTANSYGHEVWVEKYRAKMMVRKIFDQTVWVANEQVRIVQDRVAYQALLWSSIVSIPLTIVFVAVPSAGVYR